MQIESLKGHRWFIWALVLMLVAGAGLVTYIQYSSVTDPDQEPLVNVVHHAARTATASHTAAMQH